MAEEHHPPDEKKDEHKKESGLESILKDIGSMFKKTLKIGAVAALPFAYVPFAPEMLNYAMVTSYAYAASKATSNIIQEKDPLEGIVRNGFNGALLSYPIAESFKGMNSLEAAMQPTYGTLASKVTKGALMAFGLQPAVVATNTALNVGLGKKFKETYWTNIKKAFKIIAIPGILNVTWLYQFGLFTQMAVSATMSYFLNFTSINGEGKSNMKNLYNAINPITYIEGAATATAKAAKTVFYGVPQATYSIGSSIFDYFKKLVGSPAKASAPANAAPAPAH